MHTKVSKINYTSKPIAHNIYFWGLAFRLPSAAFPDALTFLPREDSMLYTFCTCFGERN